MQSKFSDECMRAVETCVQAFAGQTEVDLERVVEMLVIHLKAMPNLTAAIEESAALGDPYDDVDRYFVAAARWIIDNQLDDELRWRPAQKLRKRHG